MLNYREQIKNTCGKKEKSLQEKKEKLFLNKDVTKWGCSVEKMEELTMCKEKLLQEKERAFAFMLCQETAETVSMRDEVNYITN